MAATTTRAPRAPALRALADELARVAHSVAAGDLDGMELAAGGIRDGATGEVLAAAERLVHAVRRSHALEAAVHELFEALSHHLRIDYLAHEALNRVVEH